MAYQKPLCFLPAANGVRPSAPRRFLISTRFARKTTHLAAAFGSKPTD
jgi:hypothetical protein